MLDNPPPRTEINTDAVLGVLGIVVVVIGWVISHRLTLNAQKRQFLMQVEDTARLSVTSAIREYQTWLYAYHAYIFPAYLHIMQGMQVEWEPFMQQWRPIIDDPRGRIWKERIEEYQIVFPEIAALLPTLVDRHEHIYDGSIQLWGLLASSVFSEDGIDPLFTVTGMHAPQCLNELGESLREQRGLMQDLMVHLQSVSLGHIMGRKVPMPEPVLENANLPRVVQDGKGVLRLVGGVGKRKISPIDYLNRQATDTKHESGSQPSPTDIDEQQEPI